MRRAFAGLLGVGACTTVVEQPPLPDPAPWEDTDDTEVVDSDTEVPCELVLEPAEAVLVPRTDVTFVLSGGTGRGQYRLVDDQSGALLSPNGRYLAGPTPGTDVIEATDPSCPGVSARSTITVIPPLDVLPRRARLRPNTRVALVISGGRGLATCSLPAAPSGATVEGCVYTAGSTPGIDTLAVEEPGMDAPVLVEFTVDPNARIDVPGDRWGTLVDQPLRLPATGGSDLLELELVDGVGEIREGAWISDREGDATVRVVDPYTGMSAERAVTAAAVRTPAGLEPDGEASATTRVIGPGDLNFDGYDDVVVAVSEGSWGALRGGLVAVLAGGPTGLEAAPKQVFGGQTRDANAGRQVAVGDFDGDGRPDLVVGINGEDPASTLTDAGLVQVYHGVEEGFFEEDPSWERPGSVAGDRLGHGLATCDFDGDGFDDLAVSAYSAEDTTLSPVASAQGSVLVFLGGPGGLSDSASSVAWGRIPAADGTWAPNASMLYGRTLASGDVDGDGRCDLLVGNFDRGVFATGTSGAVYLHRGADAGVEADPARVWAVTDAADTNAAAGRSVAAGDVDGDGVDDVLIGARLRDRAGTTDWGMAALFLGGALDGPVVQSLDAADWRVYANDRSDSLGWDVDVADVDDDGLADLLISGLSDERPGGTGGAGAVQVWSGATVSAAADGRDVTGSTPTLWLGGALANQQYGGAVAAVGDVDGDERQDIAIVAYSDDTDGADVGALYLTPASGNGPGTRMTLPFRLAGHGFGTFGAADLVDTDRDGRAAVVLGGWGTGAKALGRNVGYVAAFLEDESGWSRVDGGPLTAARPGRGGDDRDGYQVVYAGDMDGDGLGDLAVVGQLDSRSATPGTGFADTRACNLARSSAGVIFVYRGRGGDQFETAPYLAQWGPEAGDGIERVAGGLDANGDGFGDLLLATTQRDGGRGGFAYVWGGPRSTAGILVRCDDLGTAHADTSTRLGSAVAALGDLDGDGCDEAAVGADADDLGVGDQGSIRILWGYGTGCGDTREVTTVVSAAGSSQFGRSIAGGRDVDADGVPDVLVGAPNTSVGGVRVGSAFFLSGARLVSLPRQVYTERLPTGGSTVPARIGVDLPLVRLDGPHVGSGFGEAVAWLAGAAAVGVPRAEWDGQPQVGLVRIYRWEGSAFVTPASQVYVGPTGTPPTAFGQDLRSDAAGRLLVGAPWWDGPGVDVGGVAPFWSASR